MSQKDRYCTYRNATWILCVNALCVAAIAAFALLATGHTALGLLLVLQAFCFYLLLRAVVIIEKLSRILEDKFTDDGKSVILEHEDRESLTEEQAGQPAKENE
jgi:hypothetical protein